MSYQPIAVGGLNSLEEMRQAIRDIAQWTDQLISDDAPTGDAQVLMRQPTGELRQFSIVAGAGCTVTVDETNRTITITVP